jgi:spore coat protein H
MNLFHIKIRYLLLLFIVAVGCEKDIYDTGNDGTSADTLNYNPDWTFASHGQSDQDYSIVFPQDSVNKIEIIMTSAQWTAVRSDMISLVGYDFGANTQGGAKLSDEEPAYINVLLKFNGKSWKNVGFRLKGNSSLRSAWGQGIYKLPFRLNFDEFEDSYPAITNQHFYGFTELTFSPGFKDQSLMREKITPEIFRMAGIPAANTSFYRVYIDFGAGLKYCGVYTAVESPDDNMINDQFGEENGNIYKPESRLSVFVESQFEKKNNETEADYSDVMAFITALNSNLRISDAVQWRTNLEAVFNIDHFIKYLAVNNAIVNWDSYGVMAHNYYLYHHSVNKLTWIPWDHNEALTGNPGITGTLKSTEETLQAPPPGGNSPLSLSMNEVTNIWPLIYNIANDSVYMTSYKEYLKWFNESVLDETAIHAMIDKYYNMITPYAIGTKGEQYKYTYLISSASYNNAYSALKTHITTRKALISGYVP